MGEFGPSFSGGGGAAAAENTPGIISPDLFVVDQQAIILNVPVAQTILGAKWHIQMEVAYAGDHAFISPIIQTDTTSDRMDWFWQPQVAGQPSALAHFPKDGIPGDSLTAGVGDVIANAVYIVSGDWNGLLQFQHHYLIRWRTSSDSGATWGSWEMDFLKL